MAAKIDKDSGRLSTRIQPKMVKKDPHSPSSSSGEVSSEKRANVARNYFQRNREPSEGSDDTVKLEDI